MNVYLEGRKNEIGAVNIWIILSISFMVVTVGLGGAFAWAYMNYTDQRDNVDAKVSTAVTSAVKKQADTDAATFEEADKKPNRSFSGPEDYGAVSFDYPKTWSVYVADDASSGGAYKAYFNPISVPAISTKVQYALRVTIETRDYDSALAAYTGQVKTGDLKSSTVKINGVDSTRLDGAFSKDIHGYAVLIKIRDKVVTIQSDAETFKGDFDALVATIKFNQ